MENQNLGKWERLALFGKLEMNKVDEKEWNIKFKDFENNIMNLNEIILTSDKVRSISEMKKHKNNILESESKSILSKEFFLWMFIFTVGKTIKLFTEILKTTDIILNLFRGFCCFKILFFS